MDDAPSVADLKNDLAKQPLDVLVNNAGIMGQSNAALGNIDYMVWQNCLTTNVLPHEFDFYYGSNEFNNLPFLQSSR